ncbi:hypothetical protein C8R45DRAFT_1106429 [Mycena sanguinolenta]|nr:hypothetical protein C8R45DRAFT_1106429 [Mycena sanguinolenta]
MQSRRHSSPRKPLRGEAQNAHEYVFTQTVAEFLGPQIDVPIATWVERPTADGRRVLAEVVPIEPPSPVKRQRHEEGADMIVDNSSAWEPLDFEPEGLNGERYNMELGGFYPILEALARCRRPRAADPFKPSDKSLFEYRPLRDEYLAELLRLDRCSDASVISCPGCHSGVPTIRCKDCYGEDLYCTDCCISDHQRHPLHIIDRWDSRFFKRTSLREVGLRIQFGHPGCVCPHRAHDDFVVLDLSRIHRVAVDFCSCTRRAELGDHRIQLLRRHWFPATHDMPKTAATFRMLEFFHMQTLQAKTTMFNFYTALEKLSNASGTSDSPPPKCYREFLQMTRVFRNLLMLKRGGRGHELGGVNGTQPGELAIQCPTCPHPNVNLPEGWEDVPAERRFLYVLFLALDACFRLKCRLVSSDLRDPGLGTGWAYFVENEPYRQYLLSVTDQDEISTCSGLAALDYANTKFLRRYSATGVGMGVCARHEFVQPNGVGDLQKGERYANMDWIFASILHHKDARLQKVVSYDIVCQWWKNLIKRLKALPGRMRLAIVLRLFNFVIPKLHIRSHTLACQLAFSLNFLLGAGQTDGEGIERHWANIGGVASSTREMGLGSRRDVLDDHWAFWNWCKLTGIALTEAQVHLKLTEEEEASMASGVPSLHDVSPSSFIYAGLELEEQQRRLRVQVELKKAGTTAQKIDLLSLRRKVSRGIARFRKLQATYTPGALQALSRLPANPNELPENTPLMLPSALSAADREAACVAGVHHVEQLARDACVARVHHVEQLARDMHLRNQLHGANTRSRTLIARNESKIRLHSERYQTAWEALRWLVGPNGNVGWCQLRREDVRTMEDAEELSERQAKCKTQQARRKAKLQQLRREGEAVNEEEVTVGSPNWEMPLPASPETLFTVVQQVLTVFKFALVSEQEDEGDGGGGEQVKNTAENVRQVSWIWATAGTTGSDAELEEALRIEWTKVHARCKRWTEEVSLLEEEYRRILVSFEHEAQRWEKRAAATALPLGGADGGAALVQGRVAYALKQADVYRRLAAKVTISMTEIHQGRGQKRICVTDTVAGPDPGEGGAEGSGGESGRRGGGMASRMASGGGLSAGQESDGKGGGGDESGGEANSDEERGDVHSDEEFFMGGEVED